MPRPLPVLLVVLAVVAGPVAALAIAPPSDPQYAAQTGPGGALALIRQPQALAAIGSTPLQDVLVSTFDTGLDLDHPEFAGRLATVPAGTPAPKVYGAPSPARVPPGGSPGWDMLGTNVPGDGTLKPDADPDDPVGQTGHGTAVAGVLGAAAGNGVGGAGVAPNARFLAMRTCWDDDECYQSIQADATEWAAARGVRVISMSWICCDAAAGAAWGDGFSTALAAATNVLFVAIPGGNGEGGRTAPATRRPCGDDAPNVLCVSTSSPTDGLDCGETSPAIVDLAVPTQNSITAVNGGGTGPTGCATSFAAPTAAGAAAVLFGLDPTATPAQVRAALIDSARPAAAWAGRSVSGGILDLEAAVKLFAQRRGVTLVPDGGATTTGTTPQTTTTTQATTPTTTTNPVDRTPPVLGAATLSRTAFVATRTNPGPSAVLTVKLNEAGALRITYGRRAAGRRKGSRCVAPASARRGARCVRFLPAGSLRIGGLRSGTSRVTFRPRITDGRALATGSYRAILQPVDAAGNVGRARTLTLTVVRRRG